MSSSGSQTHTCIQDKQKKELEKQVRDHYGEGKTPTDIYHRTRENDKNPVVLAARTKAAQVTHILCKEVLILETLKSSYLS